MPTFTFDGLTLHYTVLGEGPDVVLVHGWCSSHRMWDSLAHGLAPSMRCWLLDLPGFGDSDKPEEAWYSVPNYAQIIHAFMEAMGLWEVRLVGHSLGGMITLEVAASYPERLARLALINPLVTGRANFRAMTALPNSTQMLGRALQMYRQAMPTLHRFPNVHHQVRALKRRQSELVMGTPDSIIGSGLSAARHTLLPRLNTIRTPTLVVLGSRDVVLPNSEGHLVAVEVPNARLVTLKAGHMLTDDCPRETVQVLREFLR